LRGNGDEAYGRACIFSGDGQWKARWTSVGGIEPLRTIGFW